MDQVRQSFYNVREGNRKIYEARISFITPFETAVWNEEDLPPRRPQENRDANAGTQQNTSSQQNGTASSGSQQKCTTAAKLE